MARHGSARQGVARRGLAWRGEAGMFLSIAARPGQARPGKAWHGGAWRGVARHGEAGILVLKWRNMMLEKTTTKQPKPAVAPAAAPGVPVVRRIRITVDGIKALLTHNPESMGADTSAKRGSRIPEAEVEAEAGVYRLADGTCGIKGESFRASLLGAAGAWKAKRSTMKSHLAHVVVVEELIPLQRRDGSPIKDYVIDSRRAIVQRQGIIRRRPKFEEWSATFSIEYDPVLIKSPEIIAEIMADAGNRMGVGDYRPQKNGPFGRFQVRSFQVED
jgi:hypothetical protein